MIYISFDIGIKNLALCILRNIDNNITIVDWNVICLSEKKKSLKGANNIAKVLYEELDNIVGKLNTIDIKFFDKVIIENQPSNINGVMKTIQYLIFSYFDLLRHWDNMVGEVILINPVHKLQNHTYIIENRVSKTKLTRNEKYRMNKSDGIEICKNYIKDDEVLVSFFGSHKKKDDLADTCIQTLSYINKNERSDNIDIVYLDKNNFFI